MNANQRQEKEINMDFTIVVNKLALCRCDYIALCEHATTDSLGFKEITRFYER